MGNVIFTIYVRINCNKIQIETKYFLFLLEEMEHYITPIIIKNIGVNFINIC
jgi:hypothetical protein